MKTSFYKFLGLALAGLILGACSQTATFEDADLMNEQASAERAGFKLDPFETPSGINSKAYLECNQRGPDDCITWDPNSWFYKAETKAYTAGPQGSVTVTIHNTPTHIVYTITSTEQNIKKVTFNGVDLYAQNTNAPEPFIHSVPLGTFGEDWVACDLETATIEVRRQNSSGTGGGVYLKFETSYELIPVCDDGVQEDCDSSLVKSFIEIDNQGYHIYEFTVISANDIPNGNSWEVQLTVPQIIAYKALDGKTYTGFGEDLVNVLRWDGDITKCTPISFKIGFLPDCGALDELGKKNTNATILSVFNVKGEGNLLSEAGKIKYTCPK
ncbi:hypothetical protein [Algoriphagus mannitolivorans]|uniref:hypothetical protein n=1 Tax=Algoriphagus mannitolivorans TaxID=226504 RepID=UPI0004085540|nr:hypothetical protein [Algoriphagus mannitolivorans]